MPLAVVRAAHLRVTCDSCRVAMAEVCGKRDLPGMARVAAVRKFKSVGWHHDGGTVSASPRADTDVGSSGSGRWYCPECSSKTHL